MTAPAVFVLASDGSFGVSLLFFGPVALLLLAPRRANARRPSAGT